MYFTSRGTPGASVTVAGLKHGIANLAEDRNVDYLDSESISSAGKKKQIKKISDKPSDSANSSSVDSFDSK
jgi:hypothetical protein